MQPILRRFLCSAFLMAALPALAVSQPARQRSITMYFDLSGTSASEQLNAARAATRFLESSLRAGDTVSVIVLTATGVVVKQDFTADKDQLTRVLDQLGNSGDLGNGATEDRRHAALLTATKMLGALPGKKAMIYFTRALPTTDSPQIQEEIHAAMAAEVSLYPIDIRGIQQK
jgi:VWFA-related protein